MLGLYIHIPFCKRICSYCDFSKKIKKNQEQEDIYIDKLIKDLSNLSNYFNNINTIYIGGGTPNSITNNNLEKLLNYIYQNIPQKNILEFTIELNIELITEEQIKLFKKYNITRVSLGIQTLNKKGIKLLNRSHNKKLLINSVNLLKKYNITNINCDIIFGYFFQTFRQFKKDIKIISNLDIKHISLYSLILEDNTLLKKLYKEELLDDKLITKMYYYSIKYLRKKKFIHYELSNFSKPNYESIHNKKYWQQEEYISVGMSSVSFINNKRITNNRQINNYLNQNDLDIENLSILDLKKEFIIMGLRKTKGINKLEYKNKFNSNIEDDFNYKTLLKLNLLVEKDDIIKLTTKGYNLSNIVFREFV